MNRSKKTIAIPPAEVIREYLESRGMTQKELAIRMGTSEKNLSMLMNEKAPLTSETAEKLEMVFDVPVATWLKLESLYRADLQKIKSEQQSEADENLAAKIDYRALATLGWVQKTRKLSERICNLRKFFEVASLATLITEKFTENVAFRKLINTDKSNFLALAWCQKAKIDARKQELEKLDLTKLKSKLVPLKKVASVAKPDIKAMQEILNDCGVAMIILPQLKGSGIHGASFVTGKNVVLGLTDRRKTADVFCFSFFHELGHVLREDFYRCGVLTKDDEDEADKFAADLLIPPSDFDDFIQKSDFSNEAIQAFAKHENVDAGVIVGRLQKEGLIDYNMHNDLKHQFQL